MSTNSVSDTLSEEEIKQHHYMVEQVWKYMQYNRFKSDEEFDDIYPQITYIREHSLPTDIISRPLYNAITKLFFQYII